MEASPVHARLSHRQALCGRAATDNVLRSMGIDSRPDWLGPLRRHRQRREQGIPTVTVFVGPPGVAEWVWMQWQRESPHARAIVVQGFRKALHDWLAEPHLLASLLGKIRQRVAALEDVAYAELQSLLASRASVQREALMSRAASELDVPVDWVRHALQGEAGGPQPTFDDAAAANLIRKLTGSLPGVLMRIRGCDTEVVDLAQMLYGLTERAPELEVALALDDSAIAALEQSASPRIFRSLMEGRIALHPLRPTRRPASSGEEIRYEPGAIVRSLAERKLYAALQGRARTRGLFKLNAPVGDERNKMEVDLLCEDLKLALEVDGYYHFQEEEAYRRDRRKDLRLQQLGYDVLRVLATDIEQQPDYVLETIDGAVEAIQRRRR